MKKIIQNGKMKKMAIQDSILNIVIKAKNEAGKVLGNFDNQLKKTTGISAGAKAAIIGVGIAAGAMALKIGKDAVKAAADFEKSMSDVSTLIDTNTESMDEMKKAVLNMSKEVPVPLADLTASLYDVRSAGISASGAMDVLKQSAVLATAGLGTTKEATNILTSAINAFGLDAKESNKWANVFFEAVKAGKTTVSGLAQGFGQIAPLAYEVGIKFEELMGITSAMTTSGLDASIAYTQVRAAVSNLLKPTKEMQEIYTKLGITNIKTKITQDGLTQTIRNLSEATNGNNEMLAKAFGSVEALNAVMMLNNETGNKAIEIIKGMTDGVNLMDEAFVKQKNTFASNMILFQNSINSVLIPLGNKILPIIVKGIDALNYGLKIIGSEQTISTLRAIKDALEPIAKILGPIISGLGKVSGFVGRQIYKPFEMAAEGLVGLGAIKGYASGGLVPGPQGAAQLAVVHGGETITSPDKAGQTIIFDLRNATITDKNLMDRIKSEMNKSFNIKKFK